MKVTIKKINLYPIEFENKYGYIDITGIIVIEPKFDYGSKFSEALAKVDIGDMYISFKKKLIPGLKQ